MKYVFEIGDKALQNGVPPDLCGCPFLLMPSGYPAHINSYLQDIWTGNWHASFATDEEENNQPKLFGGRRVYRPMPSSAREIANRLVNFLHWCSEASMHLGRGELDPLSVTEKDIDRFGRQMETGLWSADHRPLSPRTIGQRQLSVIQFLQWAHAKGYAARTTFTASTSSKTYGISSGAKRATLRRNFLVVRRAHPGEIRFPTEYEVRSALEQVEDIAVQIGMKLVFFCGLRASEVCGLPLDHILDDRPAAGGQRFLRVFGKGRKLRSTEIDDDLRDEIIDYVQFERSIRLHQRGTKTHALLINANTGRGFEYRNFWQAFHRNAHKVSPHIGRHWYAVMYLLRAWRREQAKASRSGFAISTDLMRSLLSIDLIRLQQNLGHAQMSTTERYLISLSQFLDRADLAMSFQDMIDGNSGSGAVDE